MTTPAGQEFYAAHVRERQRVAETALAAAGFDALVISSGKPFTYFADDQDAPFKPTPHFAHWVPLLGPHHLLVIRPGKKPLLARFAPEDYWYEQAPLGDPFWAREFELHEVTEREKAWKLAAPNARTAYIGDEPEEAAAHGILAKSILAPELVARLDWERAHKTAYEVACLEEAERMAARGHRAALAAFERGASELAIHEEYVAAVGCIDRELPYESIVALDEKAATLHYASKRRQVPEDGGHVLLIDCGATCQGYGSDITRTWTHGRADKLFKELVKGVDKLQQELCARVRPGLPYLELHHEAHVKIADLLHGTEILHRGGEEAVQMGLTHPFFPHGLGHFLGIQVHDIGGRQKEASGGTVPPPPQYPYLRTTRRIAERQVFTVEPGVYFIEMLLRPHRSGALREQFNWHLIDRLMPCGGIRIEDNVVVTSDGHRNLTRPLI
jgi:Xaa-Pro dipeptidase